VKKWKSSEELTLKTSTFKNTTQFKKEIDADANQTTSKSNY
jgi:hypothetical protein